MSQDQVLEEVKKYQTQHVLLTGGEPLLQRGTLPLIRLLKENGYRVSIETHGEVSIQEASRQARIIMDIKTPGSGMSRGGFQKNIPHLKPYDEVKFVITSREDYEWAKKILAQYLFPTTEILFSPALPALGSPGAITGVNPRTLAEWILKDQLPVRFQIQLHKYLWGPDTKGV
jgi:7-carboxy-7-deazaguanine synthase